MDMDITGEDKGSALGILILLSLMFFLGTVCGAGLMWLLA